MERTQALSLKLIKMRDRKEQEIDIAYEHERINREAVIRYNKRASKLLDRYKVWLKDNQITGIKY